MKQKYATAHTPLTIPRADMLETEATRATNGSRCALQLSDSVRPAQSAHVKSNLNVRQLLRSSLRANICSVGPIACDEELNVQLQAKSESKQRSHRSHGVCTT